MNRREFLTRLMQWGVSAGALAVFAEPLFAQDSRLGLIPVIDAHAHLPGDLHSEEEGQTFWNIRRAGLCAMAFAVLGDRTTVGADLTYANAMDGIRKVRSWETQGRVRIVRKPSDIPLKPSAIGPIPVILSIEGGDCLGTGLGRIDEFYRLGVRMITLVHGTSDNHEDNQIGGNMRNYGVPDADDPGLSKFGYEVVARMNRLGMIVDVAHASPQTVYDVASCTRAPIIDSHTSPLPPDRTQKDPSRLRLYDEMAAIVDTGGVVCTWPYAFGEAADTFHRNSFEDWVTEIKEFTSHFGIKYIGLGTDGGGGLPKRIEGWANISSVGLLRDEMRFEGLTTDEISAFMGLNLMRVFTRCHAVAQVMSFFNIS